jgi:hypothetical protein
MQRCLVMANTGAKLFAKDQGQQAPRQLERTHSKIHGWAATCAQEPHLPTLA